MSESTITWMYFSRLGRFALGAVAVAVVLLYFFQGKLIFVPTRLDAPPPLPEMPGRTWEHVTFKTTDGLTLHGVWIGTAGPPAANAPGEPLLGSDGQRASAATEVLTTWPAGSGTSTAASQDAPATGAGVGMAAPTPTTGTAPGAEATVAAAAANTASSSAGAAAPVDSGRPVVLYSHGNGGNLAFVLYQLATLATLPVDLFAYDYRGFGQSEGTPDVPGSIRDGEAALRYLTEGRKIPLERIILYGFSIGTGITMGVARPHLDRIAGIVLEAGISSLREKAHSLFWIFGPLVLTDDFPNSQILGGYQGPLLIVHSKDDEVNTYVNAERLFAACPSTNKKLLTLTGAHHNDAIHGRPEVLAAWRDLLGRLGR